MILVQAHGQQPWILQCMNAVQEAVQNCVELLSGSPPQGNGLPIGRGGQYQFPARTREELQASQAEAAVNGHTSPASIAQQQMLAQSEMAMAAGNVDMFAVLQKQAGLYDPASQGQPVQPQQQEAPSEPASSEWLV